MKNQLIFIVIFIFLIGHNTFSQITGNPATVRVNKKKDLVLKTKLDTGITDNYFYLWNGPNSFSSTEKEPKIEKVTDSYAGTYTVKIINTTNTTITHSATITVTIDPAQVKVGFKKKNNTVLEGEELKIDILTNGIIESGKEIKISYSIINSDATTGDYTILSGNALNFKDSGSDLQTQTLTITTIKDSNEENEKFTIKLKIENLDNNWMVPDTMECTVSLKDFLTPSEKANKEFKASAENTIKSVLNVINVDKDTNAVIGKIWFSKEKVPIREFQASNRIKGNALLKKKELIIGFLLIDSVKVGFRNGVIDEVQTYGNKVIFPRKGKDTVKIKDRFENIFLGRRVPINIVRNSYNGKHLTLRHYSKEDETDIDQDVQFIYLKDYLFYRPELENNFNPGDGEISLKKEKNEKFLSVNSSLNSYIDFNIFTDLLSVLDPKVGNGLIQSELKAKFLSNTGNINNFNFFGLHYIEPYVNFSRFDNQLSSVSLDYFYQEKEIDKDGKKIKVPDYSKLDSTNVNRQLLNQRTYLSIGTKLNLLSLFFRGKSAFELNAGIGFQFSKIKGDSIITRTLIGLPVNKNDNVEYQTIGVNMLKWTLGANYIVNRNDNFGVEFGVDLWNQKVWNRKSLEDQLKLTSENSKFNLYYKTSVEMFYHPYRKVSDKIFLRLITVNGTSNSESNYYQFQIGYKARFQFKNTK